MSYLVIAGAAALFFLTSVTGAYFYGRSDGKEVIQAAWDLDRSARIQRTTEIVLQQTAISDKLQADLVKARAQHEIRTVTLVKEVPAALGNVAAVRLPAAATELYNRAVAGGEAPGGPSGGVAETPDATVADLESVAIENVGRHLACVEQVRGWQRWWGEVAATYREDE